MHGIGTGYVAAAPAYHYQATAAPQYTYTATPSLVPPVFVGSPQPPTMIQAMPQPPPMLTAGAVVAPQPAFVQPPPQYVPRAYVQQAYVTQPPTFLTSAGGQPSMFHTGLPQMPGYVVADAAQPLYVSGKSYQFPQQRTSVSRPASPRSLGRSTAGAGTIRPEMTLDQFLRVYQDIKAQSLSEFHQILQADPRIAEELVAYYERMLDYTVPGGKMTRGLTVARAARACALDAKAGTGKPFVYDEQNEFLAAVLGWCVEILQAYFLVADDVMDQSFTRRGSPCWFRIPEISEANAVNDSIMLHAVIHKLLRHYFQNHPAYVRLIEVMEDNNYMTIVGQHLDTNSQKFHQPVDLRRFTMDRYRAIVKHKTSYYSFYLPCALGMVLGGVENAHTYDAVRRVCMLLGELFQVQDDVLDCYGDPEVIGKVGTDIEEAKCSWLVCQALMKASSAQYAILENNYGSKNPESVAKVKALYRDMRLKEAFDEYEEKTKATIDRAILEVESEGMRDLLNFLLAKIYKRQK